MWQLVLNLLGQMPPGFTIPERMLMMAIAGTGILWMLTSAFELIIQVGKGGRH
jgi:hypothetical protein